MVYILKKLKTVTQPPQDLALSAFFADYPSHTPYKINCSQTVKETTPQNLRVQIELFQYVKKARPEKNQ